MTDEINFCWTTNEEHPTHFIFRDGNKFEFELIVEANGNWVVLHILNLSTGNFKMKTLHDPAIKDLSFFME